MLNRVFQLGSMLLIAFVFTSAPARAEEFEGEATYRQIIEMKSERGLKAELAIQHAAVGFNCTVGIAGTAIGVGIGAGYHYVRGYEVLGSIAARVIYGRDSLCARAIAKLDIVEEELELREHPEGSVTVRELPKGMSAWEIYERLERAREGASSAAE